MDQENNTQENNIPENEQQQRAIKRKERRKKERLQATAIAGGIVLAAVLLLALIISGIVKAVTSSHKTDPEKAKAPAKVEQTANADDDLKEDKDKNSSESDDSSEDGASEEIKDPAPDEEDKAVNTSEAGSADENIEVSENDRDETLQDQEDVSDDTGDPLISEPLDDQKKSLSEADLKAIDEEIASLTIEQKVSKLFIVSPGQLIGREIEPKNVGSEVSEKLSIYPVSGLLLKSANYSTEEELISMISNIRLMSMGRILIATEDVGGELSPFVISGITENVIASEKEIGATLGTAGAYSAGISIGSELKHYDIDLNIAPYADVPSSPSSYAAGRGFNKDMDTTGELVKNVVRGMEDQGILSAVRSFPGYGDVTSDGNTGTITSNRSKQELIDMSKPYTDAISVGSDAVLISHVSVPKLRGDQRPASLSEEVITDIVRNEWGYDGVVMTDYMDKSCIFQKYTYAEAAEGAIEAGADIILSPKNFEKSYNGIMDAVKRGKITEERIDESLRRIYKMFYAADS